MDKKRKIDDKNDPDQPASLDEMALASGIDTPDNDVYVVDGLEDPRSSENGNPSNIRTKRKRFEPTIHLCCEWNMCTAHYSKMEYFLNHVTEHLVAESGPPSNDGYLCYWRDCGSVCCDKEEFNRHVYFHAFHIKIKSIGACKLDEMTITCHLDSQGHHNVIPEIPDDFQCMWDCCNAVFDSAQNFYWHVQNHIRNVDSVGPRFNCLWQECTSYQKNLSRLRDHSRSHTQEKTIGCPNCGGIFSNTTKFTDHCERQVPEDKQQYQCSHCSRKFSTERLLRDHVRHHINHFQCPHCDMTCPTKSTLLTHLKYRHSYSKPMKCPQCDKSFKTQIDLSRHVLIHSEEAPYECSFQGCTYSCRSLTTINRHTSLKHELGPSCYSCHICQHKYLVATNLTKHLIKVHDFQWPPGHTRFRYKKDEDGFYRLQTVRYESLELNQNNEDDTIVKPTHENEADYPPSQDKLSTSDIQEEKIIESLNTRRPRPPLRIANEAKLQEIILPSEYNASSA